MSSEPAQSRPEDQTGNSRGIRLKGPAPARIGRNSWKSGPPGFVLRSLEFLPTQKTTPIREVGILARPGQQAERFP